MAALQRVTVAPAQLSNSSDPANPQTIALLPEQQHYLNRVLRLRAGDRFIAMSGQGDGWLAALTGESAVAQILETIETHTELPISATLLIAMPKTGMDDLVRQVTELGVDRIVPIRSARSLLNPSPQKRDRWQRIAQEAAEQSERQIVPIVLEPTSWAEATQQWQAEINCLCAERNLEQGDRPPLLQYLQTHSPISSLTLATGCEGGWTAAEIHSAITAGYQPVSLGSRILRAVTAPVAAMAIAAAVYEASAAKHSAV